MYDWYERAAAQLEEEYERGEIDAMEYKRYMRDLNSEYDEWAREKYPDDF